MISNFSASFSYAYTGTSNKAHAKRRSITSVTLLLPLALNPLTFSQSSGQTSKFPGKGAAHNRVLMCICVNKLSPSHASLPEVLLFEMKIGPKIRSRAQCCSGSASEHQLPESCRARIPHSFQQRAGQNFSMHSSAGGGEGIHLHPLPVSFSSTHVNQVGCHSRSCHPGYDTT